MWLEYEYNLYASLGRLGVSSTSHMERLDCGTRSDWIESRTSEVGLLMTSVPSQDILGSSLRVVVAETMAVQKGCLKTEEHRISWDGTLVMSSPTSEVLDSIQSLHVPQSSRSM